jgi:hypothetical protein
MLFLLPVAVLLCLFEAELRTIPNDFSYKKERMITDAQNIEVLILGSSHTFYGLNPEFISPHAFNAAYWSQTVDIDYKILEKYGGQMKNLRCVIIPISLFSPYSRIEGDKWRKHYIIYYGLKFGFESFSPKNYFEICNGTFISKIKRLISYYKDNKISLTVNETGFCPSYETLEEARWEESGKDVAEQLHKNDRDIGYNEKILTSIIDWCAARNIQLLFFTPPAHKTYNDNFNAAELDEVFAYMQNLAQQNDNVSYENFLFEYQDKPEYFFDPNHLNAAGARVFSMQIREILRARGLLE